MDLKTLDTVAASQKGFEVELFHPSKLSGLGVFVTVLGRDSAEYQRVQAEHNRRRLNKMHRSGNQRIVISTEEIQAEVIDLLSSCTAGWRTVIKKEGEEPVDKPVIIIGGKEFEFSKENAAMFYTTYPWVKEQIDAAVTDRANFTPR